jgi:hypothetical protein
MARYVRIRLANGDTRHATLPQEETHTQWAAREWGAESRWTQTVEGTLVARASIPALSFVELDEQPYAGRCVARAGRERGGAGRERGGAGARGFLSETLGDEPDHAAGQRGPANRSDYTPTSAPASTSSK